jgi:hypothetical protein
MPNKHGLGIGNGKIMEYEDGTAGYVESGKLTQSFRVKIADVSGFSVTKGGKVLDELSTSWAAAPCWARRASTTALRKDRGVVPCTPTFRAKPRRWLPRTRSVVTNAEACL